jgi:Niemann-Pick C1 protein
VSVLFFAPSKVFQIYFFRMYFFLILIGFFHGFIIAPIILSMYNTKKGFSASKELGPDSTYKLVNEILDK